MKEKIYTEPIFQGQDETTLKALFYNIENWGRFFLKKWVIILLFSLFGSFLGFIYAFLSKPVYSAVTTFALEDERGSATSSFAGAMGLANSLGIDLGSNGGGAFNGPNLIELMKSRSLVEKALLCKFNVDGGSKTLADYFIAVYKIDKGWEINGLKNLHFPFGLDASKHTLQQDSVLGLLYKRIVNPENGLLSVYQKDKKISIITVQVRAESEMFAKLFCESIVREVSDFYIQTKSKKARNNVMILQKQADSVRKELNEAIVGVASSNDNTFNLNPAQNIRRTPSAKRQVDIQANTAILTQIVTNLELAKVSLLKETPLIQIIDQPLLPLEKKRVSKLLSMIIGALVAVFIILFYLALKRLWDEIMRS